MTGFVFFANSFKTPPFLFLANGLVRLLIAVFNRKPCNIQIPCGTGLQTDRHMSGHLLEKTTGNDRHTEISTLFNYRLLPCPIRCILFRPFPRYPEKVISTKIPCSDAKHSRITF
jgi:hypothetical protein